MKGEKGMKITDLLKRESVELSGTPESKGQAIDQMVELMAKGGNINDLQRYKEGVLKREEEGTTGIGEGIAIPHAKTDAVSAPGLAAMLVPQGVDYDALDGQPVHMIFLIAAPNTEENVHLEVLSRLSMLLMDDEFRKNLLDAADATEFLAHIDEAERKKFPEEYGEEKQTKDQPEEGYRVLAVTACPTGIAHTYMAAESLENKAKEMGISIKVETNGSGGAKNVLTPEEIAQCECIIIAADKEVDMPRFDGKPVITTKVANGIHKAEELLTEATSGKVAVYHNASKESGSGFGGEEESLGRKIYKALMNGVSHMLPFVIGGGILIAMAFLFDGAHAGTAEFGMGNPFSRFLKQVGDISFGMMFPILAGYIAMAIADRPALMPGIVGGLLAKSGMTMAAEEAGWVSSGFFGALIAGFAAGLIMLGLKKILEKLPKALEGTKLMLLYPFLGIAAMGALMVFVVNPPVGAFNEWLNQVLASMGESSRVLLGAALGGMVPPIGIALATLFFKNRFTKSEQQTVATNFIMGLSFITEGAIPFAVSDPLRIIPPCIAGSAVAGALSMLFGCGSRAPHGGIFVIGIIDNPLLFLAAVAAGSVVAMLGIVLLKKPLAAK